jgi:hypothetical protein
MSSREFPRSTGGELGLDADARDFVYRITKGHVGTVKAVLKFFEMVSTIKSPSGSISFTYSQVVSPAIPQSPQHPYLSHVHSAVVLPTVK